MQSMKNAAASTKAGMEKSKATMQEKVDQMKANDPIEKDMARERKEDRKEDAELRKQEAHHHNATGGRGGGTGFTTGGYNRAETGSYGGGGVHDVNPGGGGGTGLTTGGDTNISGEPTNAGSRRNTRDTQEDRFY